MTKTVQKRTSKSAAGTAARKPKKTRAAAAPGTASAKRTTNTGTKGTQKRLPAGKKMEMGDPKNISSALGMTLVGSAALAAATFILTQSSLDNPLVALFS